MYKGYFENGIDRPVTLCSDRLFEVYMWMTVKKHEHQFHSFEDVTADGKKHDPAIVHEFRAKGVKNGIPCRIYGEIRKIE